MCSEHPISFLKEDSYHVEASMGGTENDYNPDDDCLWL